MQTPIFCLFFTHLGIYMCNEFQLRGKNLDPKKCEFNFIRINQSFQTNIFKHIEPTDSCLCPQHTPAHLCPQQHSKAEWIFVSQYEKKIYVSSLIPKIYCWGNIWNRENLCVCKPARSRPRLCRPDRRKPAGSCARWPGSKEGTADQQSIMISMYVQKSEIKFSESIPYNWSPNT